MSKNNEQEESMSDPHAKDDAPVVEVRGLIKTFRLGFFRKRVEAVRGVDFAVQRGEIFGLLGPNGAGKTTTLKVLLGLIFPTAGEARIFGGRPGDRAVMARLGYLPENPYVYSYLRPLEFLDLCGRLNGMGTTERRKRSQEMVERVGLSHATGRPIGKFSKGMPQRNGVAQALLHDPELLILDEPMSGLDPIGRKQVRELLLDERARGKTLIFTSHILSDVERICDRVAVLREGRVTHRGALDELLGATDEHVEVVLSHVPEALSVALKAEHPKARSHGGTLQLELEQEAALGPLLARALEAGASVQSVVRRREDLETLFMRDEASRHEGSAEEESAA